MRVDPSARLDPDACLDPSARGGAGSAAPGTPPALAEIQQGIEETLTREVAGERERTILRTFLAFNRAVSRTNSFIRDKRCLAFKLDLSVVWGSEYPDRPFGVFFFVGHELVGFHIRFRDIARGGRPGPGRKAGHPVPGARRAHGGADGLMGPGVTLPVVDGELLLGTWQQVIVIDHDNRPRSRSVRIQVVGE